LSRESTNHMTTSPSIRTAFKPVAFMRFRLSRSSLIHQLWVPLAL
jgi:hypothetical protein